MTLKFNSWLKFLHISIPASLNLAFASCIKLERTIVVFLPTFPPPIHPFSITATLVILCSFAK